MCCICCSMHCWSWPQSLRVETVLSTGIFQPELASPLDYCQIFGKEMLLWILILSVTVVITINNDVISRYNVITYVIRDNWAKIFMILDWMTLSVWPVILQVGLCDASHDLFPKWMCESNQKFGKRYIWRIRLLWYCVLVPDLEEKPRFRLVSALKKRLESAFQSPENYK